MKNKKYPMLTGVLLAICLIHTIIVFAHPGRTDENGGHWDRNAGEYHFHTGEYAGQGSSGSSSKSEYVPFTPPYDPPTENPYRKHSTESKEFTRSSTYPEPANSSNIIIIVLFLIFVVSPTIGLIYENIEKFFPGHYIYKLQETIEQLEKSQEKFMEYNAIYFENNFESTIPDKYEIGNDGKPKEKGCKYWGELFTVYISKKGTKLHSKYMCSGASIPKNIVDFRYYSNLASRLCKRCCKSYIVQDFSWYDQYLSYKNKKAEYDNMKRQIFCLNEQITVCLKKFDSKFFKFCLFFCRRNKRKLKSARDKYAEVSANIDIIHEILSINQIQDLIDLGVEESWEIAEHLNIPESYVSFAIDVYTSERELNFNKR